MSNSAARWPMEVTGVKSVRFRRCFPLHHFFFLTPCFADVALAPFSKTGLFTLV